MVVGATNRNIRSSTSGGHSASKPVKNERDDFNSHAKSNTLPRSFKSPKQSKLRDTQDDKAKNSGTSTDSFKLGREDVQADSDINRSGGADKVGSHSDKTSGDRRDSADGWQAESTEGRGVPSAGSVFEEAGGYMELKDFASFGRNHEDEPSYAPAQQSKPKGAEKKEGGAPKDDPVYSTVQKRPKTEGAEKKEGGGVPEDDPVHSTIQKRPKTEGAEKKEGGGAPEDDPVHSTIPQRKTEPGKIEKDATTEEASETEGAEKPEETSETKKSEKKGSSNKKAAGKKAMYILLAVLFSDSPNVSSLFMERALKKREKASDIDSSGNDGNEDIQEKSNRITSSGRTNRGEQKTEPSARKSNALPDKESMWRDVRNGYNQLSPDEQRAFMKEYEMSVYNNPKMQDKFAKENITALSPQDIRNKL